MKLLLLIISLLLSFSVQAQNKFFFASTKSSGFEAYVIWLWGQSNSVGTLSIDTTGVPSYFNSPLSNIGPNNRSVYIYNYNNGQWEILEYGVNQLSSDSDSYAQEIEIGYRAALKYDKDIYIVKYAESGRGITPDGGERDWSTTSDGELMDEWDTLNSSAINSIPVKWRPLLDLWVGGERDATTESRSLVVDQHLYLGFTHRRNQIRKGSFPAIIIRLNNNTTYTYKTNVQSAVDDVTSNSNSTYFIPISYKIIPDSYQLIGDNVHYSGLGQRDLSNGVLDLL